MWAEESVIYQIYPLGMCGAPYENDGVQAHRILEVKDWIPHLKKLGITAVYFCPVFESDTHGSISARSLNRIHMATTREITRRSTAGSAPMRTSKKSAMRCTGKGSA